MSEGGSIREVIENFDKLRDNLSDIEKCLDSISRDQAAQSWVDMLFQFKSYTQRDAEKFFTAVDDLAVKCGGTSV